MEKDFMGLSAKDSVIVKKEFVGGGFGDSDLARRTGVSLSSSNKADALHNWMSLKPDQEKKPSEMNSDLLASQGYMLKYGSDIIVPKHKQQFGELQNFGGSNMRQQFSGGNPFATSHPVLPSGALLAGISKPWINSKTSSVPAQLTIFYNGTVSVFNDIFPEKAQAIIYLAGNGCVPSNLALSKLHPQAPASRPPAPASRPPAADQVMVNQNMPQGSGLPSPMPVSSQSHPMNQSGVQVANNDVKASQTIGMATALINKVDLPREMSSLGTMISSVLPQIRRASLARFLEKRKERVTNAAPYKRSTMAPNCTTSESSDPCFSTASGADSNSASM